MLQTFLFLLAITVLVSTAFQSPISAMGGAGWTPNKAPLDSPSRHRRFLLVSNNQNDEETARDPFASSSLLPRSPLLLTAAVASSISWTTLSVIALSHHPDPRFAHCSLQHNLLTMSQALLFPLGILWTTTIGTATAATTRKPWILPAGLALTYAQLTASTVWAPAFCFGYDLYPPLVKQLTGGVFSASAVAAALRSMSTLRSKNRPAKEGQLQDTKSLLSIDSGWRKNAGYCLYSAATIGFFIFSSLPFLSGYPRATIPTILGKRLSRPATCFHWLGGAASYYLMNTMRKGTSTDAGTARRASIVSRGLAWSSGLHLALIVAKLVGVDDGGLLIPGRGLWEVYPAMIAVPRTLAASLLLHLSPVLALLV